MVLLPGEKQAILRDLVADAPQIVFLDLLVEDERDLRVGDVLPLGECPVGQDAPPLANPTRAFTHFSSWCRKALRTSHRNIGRKMFVMISKPSSATSYAATALILGSKAAARMSK